MRLFASVFIFRSSPAYSLPHRFNAIIHIMVQKQLPQVVAERRCPNCGTRVARETETCFMCGYDLRIKPKRAHRISWIDAVLVLAVLAVLLFWWQLGGQVEQTEAAEDGVAILPTELPVLGPTETPTPTPIPTETPTPLPPEEVIVTHEVRPGENLLAIAGFYGVSVEEVQKANNLKDALIRVGDKLKIPVERQPEKALPAESIFNYIVLDGDTINSIAILFGAKISDILQANDLGPNEIIRPGQVLLVPVRNVPAGVLNSSDDTASSNVSETTSSSAQEDNKIYIEPRLIGPPNDTTLSRVEPVLLRWASVDILAPDEWYVLQINAINDSARPIVPIWTKTTSYRLNPELAPPAGQSARYSWQVSVIRVIALANDQYRLEAISPSSTARIFTWQ